MNGLKSTGIDPKMILSPFMININFGFEKLILMFNDKNMLFFLITYNTY